MTYITHEFGRRGYCGLKGAMCRNLFLNPAGHRTVKRHQDHLRAGKGDPMRISDIIRTKGNTVVTVAPDMNVRALLSVLAEHHIGAVVVSADGDAIDGIISERDIVRALAARGAAVLSEYVQGIMTADVSTCGPDAHVDELAEAMTEGRFRHMPVVDDDRLTGLVSIGDVVKSRITELEVERDSLSSYIRTAST